MGLPFNVTSILSETSKIRRKSVFLLQQDVDIEELVGLGVESMSTCPSQYEGTVEH